VTAETDAACFVCTNSASDADVPRENIARTRHWRVAHAFNSTLPGWLVVVPLDHVESFAGLAPAAMSELGELLGATSRALQAELGCRKTYTMQFSEAQGFQHLHVHVVPRMADLPEEHRGPRIFHYLSQHASDWPSTTTIDALATRLAAAVARER
jgi:diadenosine tetraphosphate (Ap4A) HIT family hydrolase